MNMQTSQQDALKQTWKHMTDWGDTAETQRDQRGNKYRRQNTDTWLRCRVRETDRGRETGRYLNMETRHDWMGKAEGN